VSSKINGDLISAKFKLDPYILPNGTYGVSFDLKSVQKIKAGRVAAVAPEKKESKEFGKSRTKNVEKRRVLGARRSLGELLRCEKTKHTQVWLRSRVGSDK
jgi:hypothetical protein